MGNFSSVRAVSLKDVREVKPKAKKNPESDSTLKSLNERRAQGRKWNFGSRVKSFFEKEGRRLELNSYARKLRTSDFNGLYRTDGTSPGKWVAKQKAAVQPLVDQMKDCMLKKLGKRNPEDLNDQEKHKIAVAVWSLVIPGLSDSHSKGIPEESKKLAQELLESLESSSSDFRSFDVQGREKATTSALDMAFFIRGFQALGATSPRLRALQNARQSQLSAAEKSEMEAEEKLNRFALEIADFGRAACGLKNSGKPSKIKPTDSDFKHGEEFFANLREEILARVSTIKEGGEGLKKLGDRNQFQVGGFKPTTGHRAPKIMSKGADHQSAQGSPGAEANAASQRDKSLVGVQDTEVRSVVKSKSGRLADSTIVGADGDDESEESASLSKPLTGSNSAPPQLNCNSFRIVNIGEGSPLQPKVARAMADAADAFDAGSIDEMALNSRSERFYRSFLRELQKQDPNVQFAQGLKAIASGQLDNFVRRLGAIVAQGSNFLPEVNWQFAYDSKRKCVQATYSLEWAVVRNTNTRGDVDANERVGLSGEIDLFPDDSEEECVLENPRVYISEGPQGGKRRDDDSVSESIVSSSSSSEEESAETTDETMTKSSEEDSNLPLSTKPTPAVASPPSVMEIIFAPAKPKWERQPTDVEISDRRRQWKTRVKAQKMEKNPPAQLARAGAQKIVDLSETAKMAVKKAEERRAERAKEREKERAEMLVALKESNLQKGVIDKVIADCIVPGAQTRPLESGKVLEFLSRIASDSPQKSDIPILRQMHEALSRRVPGVKLSDYAEGLLACALVLNKNIDALNTIPIDRRLRSVELRKNFASFGKGWDLGKWLDTLIDFRTKFDRIEQLRKDVTPTRFLIERLDEQLAAAKIPRELLDQYSTAELQAARSYVLAWQMVDSKGADAVVKHLRDQEADDD